MPTKASLDAAIRSIVKHNVTKPARLNGSHTMAEISTLDPMRRKMVLVLRQEHGGVHRTVAETARIVGRGVGREVDHSLRALRALWVSVAIRATLSRLGDRLRL